MTTVPDNLVIRKGKARVVIGLYRVKENVTKTLNALNKPKQKQSTKLAYFE